MPTYAWDPALETGNELVDSQHKYLFSLLNELLAAAAPDSSASVADVLDRLTLYAATHFGEEERLMESSGFPADSAEAHKREHRDLSQKTRQLVIDYRLGKVPSVIPVAEFLCGWLGHHIEQEDRGLIEHLRAQREAG